MLVLAWFAGCSSSSTPARAGDGGVTDGGDGGQLACGKTVCSASQVCVVPPCDCVSLAEPSCPQPYCVTPTPDASVSCTPLDGGLSGTITAPPATPSRYCYHICI